MLRSLSISLGCTLLVACVHAGQPVTMRIKAPEFSERATEDWLNSPALQLADLRGKVVILHFWTFG